MALRKQNINLQSAAFPLLSANRESRSYVKSLDADPGTPTPLWLENVMPIKEGYSSVSFEDSITHCSTGCMTDQYEFTNMHLAYNSGGESTYLLENFGKLYVYLVKEDRWDKIAEVGDAKVSFSVFFLKGATYVFHQGMGLKKFGATFSDFDPVVTTGIVGFDAGKDGNIIAMTSVLSYIVAASKDTIYWSDPLDETNFDPATPITSLAGSAQVLALKGQVRMLLPLANGFVIYTDSNAIMATYTNNPTNPFFFKEVSNSAGVFYPFHVTSKTSLPLHFVWSDSGLMSITSEGAQGLFPEVSDFLASNVLESYDRDLREIVSMRDIQMYSKITYINSRYLAISYGQQDELYKFILMYDTLLQRWGKIAIDHKCVFPFVPPAGTGGVTFTELATTSFTDMGAVKYSDIMPKLKDASFNVGSMGILTGDAVIVKADWLASKDDGEGLLIFTNISLARSSITSLNELELYGNFDPDKIELAFRSLTYNPKWKITQYVRSRNWFVGTTTGKEHEISIKGSFQLSEIVNRLSMNGAE